MQKSLVLSICSVCVEDTTVKFICVPTSTNVSVGEVWEFNCTAEGVTHMNWAVNGETMKGNHPGFTFTKTMSLNDITNLRTTLLRATGSSYTNGSNISCVVFNDQLFLGNESPPPALFLAQGIINTSNHR